MSKTIKAPWVKSWRHIELHTDGSCLRNPGPGGWAAILQEGKRELVLVGREALTTNNRMEMMALIRGLQKIGDRANVLVFTDSMYVIEGAEFATKNRNKGWKGGKLKNKDLLELVYQELCRHRINFEWVRGHSGNEMNNRCDTLARAESAAAAVESCRPFSQF